MILTDNLPPFLFSATINASQKGQGIADLSKKIEKEKTVTHRKSYINIDKFKIKYEKKSQI